MVDVAPPDPDLRLGVAGVTDGNGHPYSFASIVNGYDADAYGNTSWDGILKYLMERDSSEFGFPDVAVTHAWTQDHSETERLCAAARIPNVVERFSDLADLDGVLLLRDDYERHYEMAVPLIEAGTPVFVDKPLTLDPDKLAAFEPHLRDGNLFSCSGLRFARELDTARNCLETYGSLRLVRGTVLFNWPRYGVHVLEAILNTVDAQPVAVKASPAEHASVTIETDAGYPIEIDALGDAPPTFEVDIYGSQRTSRHQLQDNFSAFRRTLFRVVQMVRSGKPAIDPEATLEVVRALIAGQQARKQDRRVALSELE